MFNIKKTLFFIIAIFLISSGALFYFTYFEGEPPSIVLQPSIKYINPTTQFNLQVSDKKQGLKSVNIFIKQNKNKIPLLHKKFNKLNYSEIKFKLPTTNLRPGKFILFIEAQDSSLKNFGQGNIALIKKEFIYDPVPPQLSLLSRTHYLNQGGSGLIVFKANEPIKNAGIKLNNYFFPAYYNKEQNKYYCLFAWPYNLNKNHTPVLLAEDIAGNIAKVEFYYHLNPKKFPHDKINISDSFLNKKMPYFQHYFPEIKDKLQLFLKVNRILRQANREELKKIGLNTSTYALFTGKFKRLPNAARKASFGEIRDYFYQGKKIDRQTHLGLDLASIARAKVPASNTGKVVFADEMGIYGKVVILDHGLGLQTLYAHLSEIKVNVGQVIKKGSIIGRTGATGLAGGDHLHFAVLVSGIPVNPVEWLDLHWLKNNIYDRLP
ncbi:M23 family metallopeptidase [Desulfonauticus submarinus]